MRKKVATNGYAREVSFSSNSEGKPIITVCKNPRTNRFKGTRRHGHSEIILDDYDTLTTQQVSCLFHTGEKTIRKHIRSGKLPSVSLNSRYKILVIDVINLLQQKRGLFSSRDSLEKS